jgi:hypothetical protein
MRQAKVVRVRSSDTKLIQQLLDSPSVESCIYSFRPIALNRRQFLGVSTGTLASVVASPLFAADGLVVSGTDVVAVSLNGASWIIDPKLFAPGTSGRPTATWKKLPTISNVAPRYFIQLKSARLPGTSINCNFKAEIYFHEIVWFIRLKFDAFSQSREVSLSSWLQGETAIDSLFEQPSAGRIDFGSAGNYVTLPAGDVRLSINSKFDFDFLETEQPMTLAVGACKATVDRMLFRLATASSLCVDLADVPATHRVTAVHIECIAPHGELIRVGTFYDGNDVSLAPTSIGFNAECFEDSRGRRNAAVVFDGCGAIRMAAWQKHSPPINLQAERLCFAGLTDTIAKTAILGAKIARSHFGIEVGPLAVEIQGQSSGEPLIISVQDGRVAAFTTSVEILRAHVPVRGSDSAAVELPAIELKVTFGQQKSNVSAPGTTKRKAEKDVAAELNSADLLCECAIPPPNPRTTPEAAASCRDASLIAGPQPSILLPLEFAELRLRRNADLFNLSFQFQHYEMRVANGKTSLRRRWAIPRSCAVGAPDSRLIVQFPPQHVFEEAAGYQNQWGPNAPAPGQNSCSYALPPPAAPAPPSPNRNCRVEPPLRNVTEIDITKTRVAGPTRIAFSTTDTQEQEGIPAFRYKDQFEELTIEDLTDWRDLALVVHHRALPFNADLQAQLAAARPVDLPLDGITPETTREVARTKIVQSLTEPSHWQTAIELPYRLLMSPDSGAKFDTPHNAPDPSKPLLWNASLQQDSTKAVRALHARHFNHSYLSQNPVPDSDDISFVGPMIASDRREIVGLTSVYGVPGLRRLQVAHDQPFDDPRSMVIRPKQPYAMLDQPALISVPGGGHILTGQEGFIIAKPFEKFDLILTSVGATLSALWSGEPPAAFQSGGVFQFFNPSYTIEKYTHRTMFGRDIHVEINYKGFLFPIGHRAALVKLSERMFLPQRLNVDSLRPTAYLAQRQFIIVKKPKKPFPAFGQNFESRDFPCNAIEILTTPTPDLTPTIKPVTFSAPAVPGAPPEISPEDKCKIAQGAMTIGKVFWPRTAPGGLDHKISFNTSAGSIDASDSYGNEVIFEYKVDANKPPVRSPLLFVDNAAAHDAGTMENVVKYYRALPGGFQDLDYLKQAEHVATSRLYAPEIKAGDTTYQTKTWTLSARGRIVMQADVSNPQISVEAESFAMDAFMEGADQPPFYPWVDRARVTMQSLDRLLGRSQGLIDVGFPEYYVRYGFEATHNPSEIYLDVISPQIQLDVSGQGDTVGGIAQTNAMLASISRKVGFVGGLPKSLPAPQGQTVAVPPAPTSGVPVGNSAPARFDNSSAVAGRFDPMEFFGGALKDAKLLGVVSLKDILRAALMAAAPKLEEAVSYAIGTEENESAAALSELLRKLTPKISSGTAGVLTDADRRLRELNQKIGSSSAPPLSLGDLYPDAVSALTQLNTTSRSIYGAVQYGDVDLPTGIEFASELLDASREVLNDIERFAENPIPAVITNTLTTIQKAWTDVRDMLSSAINNPTLGKFIDDLQRLTIDDASFAAICQAIVSLGVFPALLGSADYDLGVPSSSERPSWNKLVLPKSPDKPDLREICNRFFKSPEDVLAKLQEALFYEVFSGPLANAISALNVFAGQIRGEIAWSRQAIAERITGILKSITVEASASRISSVTWKLVTALEAVTSGDFNNDADAQATINRLAIAATSNVAAIINSAIGDEHDGFFKDVQGQISQLTNEIGGLERREAAALRKLDKEYYKQQIAQYKIQQEQLGKLLTLYNQIKVDGAQSVANQVVNTGLAEINKGLRKYEDQAKQLAKQGVRAQAERAVRLIDSFFDAGIQSAAYGIVAKVGREATSWMGPWCGPGDIYDVPNNWNVVQTIQNIASNVLSETTNQAEDFAERIKKLQDSLDQAEIPPHLPAELVVRAQQARSALSQSLQRVAAFIAELLRARNSLLGYSISTECEKIAELLNITARVMELRRKAVKSVHDVLEDCSRMIDAIDDLSASETSLQRRSFGSTPVGSPAVMYAAYSNFGLGAVSAAINQIAADLANILSSITSIGAVTLGPTRTTWANIHAKVTQLADVLHANNLQTSENDIRHSLDALERSAASLAGRITADIRTISDVNKTPQEKKAALNELKSVARDVMDYAAKHDRRLAALVLQAANIDADFETKLCEVGLKVVRTAASILVPLHQLVMRAFDEIWAVLDPLSSSADDALVLLLTKPLLGTLTQARAAVAQDADDLQKLSTSMGSEPDDVQKAIDIASGLRKRWQSQGIGLVLATQNLSDLFSRVTAGHFDAIFNFDAIEGLLRYTIAQIVPVQVTLTYDFGSALGDFPPDDPIFAMDREAIAVSSDGGGQANDLTLSALIDIDLIRKTRTTYATGKTRPFKIRLLGDRFDLLTIYFSGAHFEVKPGQQTQFRADVSHIRIGDTLSFISSFSSLFGSSNDNGPYIKPYFSPPGIEVGYRFHRDLIEIGELELIDFGIEVSALLPFDDRAAEFRFALASRDRPFLIAAPPYGGGGFVALTATGQGFVSFELLMEFGAVMAIDFGPLSASGSVTAGIYMLSGDGGNRVLQGFVHAIGEGNIACFGLTVNIEVETHEDGSRMGGSSTYEFTYKVGFAKISYGFEAAYGYQGGGGSSSSARLAFRPSLQREDAPCDPATLPHPTCVVPDDGKTVPIRRNMPKKSIEWNQYREMLGFT